MPRFKFQQTFVAACSALLVLSSCQTLVPTQTANRGLNPTARLKIQARRGRLHCPPGALNCNPQDMSLPDEDQFILPPEYSPTQAVIVSDKLMEYPGSMQLLQALIQSDSDIWMLSKDQNLFQNSQRLLQISVSPFFPMGQSMYQLPIATDSIWSRDYGPISTFPDAEYQGPKLDYKLMNSYYYPDRFQDDRVPASLSRVLNSPIGPISQRRVFTSQLNLALEGGNLMCNDSICFVSDKVIERNLGQTTPNGQTWTSVAEIQAEFASQFQQPVHFVSALPGEGTGHIDMWAKFINQKTLLIGQISEQSVALADPIHRDEIKALQAFLDIQASGVDGDGAPVSDSLYQQAKQQQADLQVVRIPMPLPMLNDAEFSVFRSYTNALIVNQKALIPQYRNMPDGSQYPDSSLLNQYEQAVQKAYQAAGYEVKWIPSDQWIAMGGGVHCVTMQIPKTPTAM